MDIAEILTQDRVIPSLRVSDKEQLLQELSRRAAALSKVPQKQILAAIEARESLGSTGLGQGFALPHARLKEIGHFFGLFARLARPIPYQAVDDNPVDLVFLLLVPSDPTANYVSILAAIARRIRDQDVARALRKADNAAALRALLVGGGGAPIAGSGPI
jgi:nitrogen PTS system EIIA component